MLKKEINLRAYFKSYDATTKKATMLFLDDDTEKFTKEFLTQYYSASQNNPIRMQEFYVKFDQKKSFCYLDKSDQIRVPIQDLLNKVIIMVVFIKHYNFNSNGKKIQGWNINLLKMNPL